MTVHELKTWPRFFEAILRGEKTFEARRNDRNHQVGDVLLLREYRDAGGYTGRTLRAIVTYILYGGSFGVEEGHCIMAIWAPLEGADE